MLFSLSVFHCIQGLISFVLLIFCKNDDDIVNNFMIENLTNDIGIIIAQDVLLTTQILLVIVEYHLLVILHVFVSPSSCYILFILLLS